MKTPPERLEWIQKRVAEICEDWKFTDEFGESFEDLLFHWLNKRENGYIRANELIELLRLSHELATGEVQ